MINNVVLVGRLTRDPDLKYTSNGTAVASFTLAVERNFKDGNGDKQVDFLNCVVWQKQAETLTNYTRKGHLLGVQGRLQSRSYDNQQGQKIYVTEVVVNEFQFLEQKEKTSQGQQGSRQGNNYGNSGKSQMPDFDRDTADPFGANASSIDISDDDLPF